MVEINFWVEGTTLDRVVGGGFFEFLTSVPGIVQKSRDTRMNNTQLLSLKRSQSRVG